MNMPEFPHDINALLNWGAGVAQVRALASHQCGSGSIPRLGVICGLNLLVLYSAPRGFFPGTPVFPLLKNQCFDLLVSPISALVLNPLTLK